ncbi:MAG: NAD(P)-dependent oxidoreductase [Candidatus Peribacteraceae bacterium]|nr:NAD(P)-dependent oxidoreductase [Candidatus Peribacteraceae bacterium]
MSSPIVFLEVEPQDRSTVTEHFGDAVILAEDLQGKGILEKCKDAEIISCFIYSQFTKDALKKLPKLKLIATRSVGYDHIDLAACKERDIVVCNVPDYGSHVIAEHVFALLLGTLRHVREGDERVEGGTFDYHGLRGITLRGKTIGIIGTGKIGRRVAQIAHGFSMKILATDRCRTLELEDLLGVEYVPLPELLAQSDIITIHVPAIPETEHMISSAAFKQMKDGVILVNTARGSVIDSPALVKAIKSGKVRYALLDVLEHEKNFSENKELIAFPGVVSTPHIAFYTDESMGNMYHDAFLSIEQWKTGAQPEHFVKPPQVICDLSTVKNKK